NSPQAEKYRNLREQRLAAMQAVLWDEQQGAWFDYDLDTGRKNTEFYPTNLTPLWAGCFSDPGAPDKALKYLEAKQILNYKRGIPSSLKDSGQQWDLPNAWAPLQDFVIRGREAGTGHPRANAIPWVWRAGARALLALCRLARSHSPRTQEVAFQLAQNWIRTNFDVYSKTSAMYEKVQKAPGLAHSAIMPGTTWELLPLFLLGLALGTQQALPPPCESVDLLARGLLGRSSGEQEEPASCLMGLTQDTGRVKDEATERVGLRPAVCPQGSWWPDPLPSLPCSLIYCHGELLHQVQMAKLYQDDKEFVDMPMRKHPDQVLESFNSLSATYNHSIPRDELMSFVNSYFLAKGQELDPWSPEDWKESPQLLYNISDPNLQAWAGKLHELWKDLGKKVRPEVSREPERFSLLYSEHPFIVPGGRFVEFYYWDSYWVVEGLLLSQMPQTVKGMLRNFLDLVRRYGHIPNGARVYYLQRSQPPLLPLMMSSYVKHTQDLAFLRDSIDTLASELDFWAWNRSVVVSVGGKGYVLNRYHVPYGGPRPESYSKDVGLADTVPQEKRERLWAELKAGAESGWDFSSRWFVGGPDPNLLSSIRTSKLVPVDLNAFLCQAEALMSSFYSRLGNSPQAEKYRNLREQRLAAMQAVLWDEQQGAWFDYDLDTGRKNTEFYPTNLTPLWAGCFSDPGAPDKALKYLEAKQILNYKRGIPSSLKDSGQQWDLPNAWAPLQDFVIRGLARSHSPRTQEVAFQLAQNWIRTNFDVYSKTSAMYEKYDINKGQPGGGGEYEVQTGFGWTNGVVMILLDLYGDRLTSGSQLAFLEPHCLAAALLLSLLLSFLSQ
ncbi:Trehalase, partial [Galemys pyrenaicus]